MHNITHFFVLTLEEFFQSDFSHLYICCFRSLDFHIWIGCFLILGFLLLFAENFFGLYKIKIDLYTIFKRALITSFFTYLYVNVMIWKAYISLQISFDYSSIDLSILISKLISINHVYIELWPICVWAGHLTP